MNPLRGPLSQSLTWILELPLGGPPNSPRSSSLVDSDRGALRSARSRHFWRTARLPHRGTSSAGSLLGVPPILCTLPLRVPFGFGNVGGRGWCAPVGPLMWKTGDALKVGALPSDKVGKWGFTGQPSPPPRNVTMMAYECASRVWPDDASERLPVLLGPQVCWRSPPA